MLNGLYGYFFGSEHISGIDAKENVSVMKNSIELLADSRTFTLNKNLENKEDDWIFLDEPDLIAIDDDDTLAVTNVCARSTSSVWSTTPLHANPDHSVKFNCTACFKACGGSPCPRNPEVQKKDTGKQARENALKQKELERQLFGKHLSCVNDASERKANTAANNSSGKFYDAALNKLNTGAKLKRSTAAGHFASDSKTKQRSKKSSRLLVGRNNDRKVNSSN
ncbi:unnamed protein product [Thelazia callipaeda]|uniref:DNA-directed DNA polymerase n=1 Tax=Thelazia callipaeda TaxID=103827 RepID=A0A0N5D1L3_THECL|nr:unnamed protein product [Thelazia callipaeda]